MTTLSRTVCAAVLLALLSTPPGLARPKADDKLGPPAGITSTTATLPDVLAKYHGANGPSGSPIVIDSTYAEAGLSGTEHYISAGSDYRSIRKLGPFLDEDGRFAGQRWEMNENGLARYVSGIHQHDELTVLSRPDSEIEADLKLLGETQDPAAYILEYAPGGGHRQWYFVDRKTSLLDRIEEVVEGERTTYLYDDYEVAPAGAVARHIHVSEPAPDNDIDERVVHYERPAAIDKGQFAIPGNSRILDEFPPGVSRVDIPAQFVSGDIVVRATINGRGLDFILDSGSSGILIDSRVVRQLNLPTYGKWTENAAGSFKVSSTIVPEIRLGRLRLANVVADSASFTVDTEDMKVKEVGLLGFDFIADAVIHVDYEHQKVEAIRNDDFHPETIPGATEIPVDLDDGVPVAHIRVGSTRNDNFIIDTGAGDIMVFSAFSARHPDDVKDQGKGRDLQDLFSYVEIGGVGGSFKVTPTELASVTFGPASFRDVMAMQPQHAEHFEGEDYDGLIGYQLLRFFDVYFDYLNGRVVVAPNAALLRGAHKPPPPRNR